MILLYENINHLNLIYGKDEKININNKNKYCNINDIEINKSINIKNIELIGNKHENKYVEFKNAKS